MYFKVRYQVFVASFIVLLGSFITVALFDGYHSIQEARKSTMTKLRTHAELVSNYIQNQSDNLKAVVTIHDLSRNRVKRIEHMQKTLGLSELFMVRDEPGDENSADNDYVDSAYLNLFNQPYCALTRHKTQLFYLCGYRNEELNGVLIAVKPFQTDSIKQFAEIVDVKVNIQVGDIPLPNAINFSYSEMSDKKFVQKMNQRFQNDINTEKGSFELKDDFLFYHFKLMDYKGDEIGMISLSEYVPDIIGNVIDQLKQHTYIYLGILLVAFLASIWIGKHLIFPLELLHKTMKESENGVLKPVEFPKRRHLDEMTDFMARYNRMIEILGEKEKIKELFGKYVSEEMRDAILSNPDAMEGTRQDMTVMFVDIANFTTFSEANEASAVVELLNEYFSSMVKIVYQHQGVVDKFLGDGMMILFGMKPDRNHALDAVIAARMMLEKAEDMDINIRIGIHSGEVVLGSIGANERMEYTAIGDTVNVAARLEQSGKPLKKKLVFSENTQCSLNKSFHCQLLDEIEIRGRKGKLNVYTLIN